MVRSAALGNCKRSALSGNSAEKKTSKWLDIEERDAGNLGNVAKAAQQKIPASLSESPLHLSERSRDAKFPGAAVARGWLMVSTPTQCK